MSLKYVFDYINTDEFILIGFLFYYVFIPSIVLFLLFIINLICDYHEFLGWKELNKKED